MKIMYFGKFQTSYSTEKYVTKSLKQIGHDVLTVPIFKYSKYEVLIQMIEQNKPDVLLFTKTELPCFYYLIRWAKSEGIKTVTWNWDVYRTLRNTIPVHFCVSDHYIHTDGSNQAYWKHRCDGKVHVLRQGIFLPEAIMIDNPDERKIPLAFYGSIDSYQKRFELIIKLSQVFELHVKNQVRNHRLNMEFSNTKLILGDSYPLPNYWSNRVYETLGRGGLLLHPKTEGLDKEFIPGEHFIEYERNNLPELIELIKYWLDPKRKEERDRIRKAGYEYCVQNHTYNHRVSELIKIINE